MTFKRTHSVPSRLTQRQPTPLRTPRRSRILIFGTTHRSNRLSTETRTHPNSPISPPLLIRANRHSSTLARHPMVIWPQLESPIYTGGAQVERIPSSDGSACYYQVSRSFFGKCLFLLSSEHFYTDPMIQRIHDCFCN